jgi:hypothetical protein
MTAVESRRGTIDATMVVSVEKPILGLTRPPAAPFGGVHRTWLALLQRDWHLLAVVPADGTISAGALTAPLAEVAKAYDFTSVMVRDATGTDLLTAPPLVVQLGDEVRRGARVVAAIDCPLVNPSGVSLVMAADAVLLVVRYGATDLAAARALVDMLGRDKILGCVATTR